MVARFLSRNSWSICLIAITLGIFVIDEVTPLGFGIWELYAIPLWLAFRIRKVSTRSISLMANMAAVLTVAGVAISAPGGILLYAVFNRCLGALIFWAGGIALNTARKNEAAALLSEERLRVSEERYRLLTQAVPSMIYERYSSGGNFFYTDDWYSYTGLTPEQTAGDGWMRAVHPEDIERFKKRSPAEKKPALMHERRMRFRRKDGQYRWMLTRSVPVRAENGEIIRRVGAITDIDEMVRAQNALRDSEAQFRAMFEAAVVGQSQASALTGLFTRVNQRLCEMTGYSEAELLEMKPGDLVHPADVVGGLLPVLEENKDEIVREVRLVRKDGKVIWVNAAIRLLRDENNSPAKTIAVYQDITGRKRAEEHRQRILDGLLLAQDIVAAGVWDLDLTQKENYFSPAYRHLYGFGDSEDITFARWLDSIIESDRGRVAEAARQLYDSGTDWNAEFGIEHPERGRRWLASVGRLERTDDGRLARFTGMDVDITERKQMEARLQDYVEVLRDADRRKDEFLAMLGHELRNPLHAIRGAIDVLQLAGISERETETARGIVDSQVTQMARLIDDLLDVSRLTLDKLELRKISMSLVDALEGALSANGSEIAARGLDVKVDLQNIPSGVHGDRVRLIQVFSNLISNAVKYTPKHGNIWVTARSHQGAAIVSIKDDGLGIPAEKLSHLFDLFYQGQNSPESANQGLGIGLTLARRLIELHGGRIEAMSEGVGKGSEFLVYLPLLEGQIADGAARPSERSAAAARPRRILVVDDNQATTRLLAMLLENLNFEVATANDGWKALEIGAPFQPEVILLDLSMPGLDGYETCRRIRKQKWGKDLVLFAVTGWGGGETQVLAKSAGFDDLVIKPVKVNDILDLAENAFEERRLASTGEILA